MQKGPPRKTNRDGQKAPASEGGRYKGNSRVGAHPLQTSQRVGHPGERSHLKVAATKTSRKKRMRVDIYG